MLEKLQVPNLDEIVSVVRSLRFLCLHDLLRGWVIDEKKTSRQVSVLPSHRHLAVVGALWRKGPWCIS